MSKFVGQGLIIYTEKIMRKISYKNCIHQTNYQNKFSYPKITATKCIIVTKIYPSSLKKYSTINYNLQQSNYKLIKLTIQKYIDIIKYFKPHKV